MKNLVKKNNIGQVVSINCNFSECGSIYPHCYECALVGHDDIREIMNKLFKYEQTGLTFEE